jgi:hypothetical protein
MADPIKLVQGDTRPFIKLTLTQPDGSVVNLTGCTVNLHFRPAGDSAAGDVQTIACSLLTNGSDGKVQFSFPTGALDVAGRYEGEVEINFGNGIQTVYDILKFSVREQFI